MVDSIKNQARALKQDSRPDTGSLRTSFKNISSGLKVPEQAAASEDTKKAAAGAEASTGNHKVSHLLRNLNDAVSFSTLALKALEQATVQGALSQVPDGVSAFSKDLTKVRDNIQKVLDDLKHQADTADVLKENLTSADAKIDDVDAAQAFATETGSQIHSFGVQAINAHGGLNPDTVAALLAE